MIYEVTLSHLLQIQERYYFTPEGESRVKVDLGAQWEEYRARVDCFAPGNADRFFALRRLAETNVVAANELGRIYYHGCRYTSVDAGEGSHGVYRVEADRNLAAQYFIKAVSCDPMIPNACWFLGDMIWRKRFPDIREEDREEAALSYFDYAMNRDFMPAYNSVGMIELSRGDALLEKGKCRDAEGEETDRTKMLRHYCRGLELCDKAGCMGWVYGHINVANFLTDGKYADRIWPEVRKLVKLQGPGQARERWKAAADMGSFYAMDRLALLDYRQGRIRSAAEIWERAAGNHYPGSSLNLARYIYGPEGSGSDRQLFRRYLEQASADGSAQASYALAALYRESDPFMARMLLERAGEQSAANSHRKEEHVYYSGKTEIACFDATLCLK